MLTTLRRGLAAGAIGGLLGMAFGYLLGEPLTNRAVAMEAARARAAGETVTETFSRSTQQLGFLGAMVLVGLALGVLYAVVSRLTDDGRSQPWGRAIRLGAGAFFGLTLVPFLRYPGNPPGVGDAATIGARSGAWQLALVIGLLGVTAAGLLARQLRDRGTPPPYRHLAVTGLLVLSIALTFVLPDSPDPVNAPATLVWDFRVRSLAMLALLWGGLAAAFGLLEERAARRTV